MVFQFTLGGIEKSNQGHWVFIGMCMIGNVLLDSVAVRPRDLLFEKMGTILTCKNDL